MTKNSVDYPFTHQLVSAKFHELTKHYPFLYFFYRNYS